jgi:hypothetical protein
MSPAEQIEATRLREVALHQAAHDCKGNLDAEDVVKRAEVYLGFLGPPDGHADIRVKHMVDRFLSWKLPKTFNPDNGISFTKPTGVNADAEWPSGTNLLDADQAAAMVCHMLSGPTEIRR